MLFYVFDCDFMIWCLLWMFTFLVYFVDCGVLPGDYLCGVVGNLDFHFLLLLFLLHGCFRVFAVLLVCLGGFAIKFVDLSFGICFV